MKFSKILLSVAVATSFLVGSLSGASAASKMSEPHSDLKMELSKAPALNVPGMVFEADEATTVKVAGRRGRRAFGLVAGAIIAGAIASQYRGGRVYRSYPRRRYYGPRRCHRLARKCDWGRRRACRKYYNHCEDRSYSYD